MIEKRKPVFGKDQVNQFYDADRLGNNGRPKQKTGQFGPVFCGGSGCHATNSQRSAFDCATPEAIA